MALAETKLNLTETEFYSLVSFLAYGCTPQRIFTLQDRDRLLTAEPIIGGIELVLIVAGKQRSVVHLTRKQVTEIVLLCGHYGRIFS
jgi:hypothetical protein